MTDTPPPSDIVFGVRGGEHDYTMVLPDHEEDYIQSTVATRGTPYEAEMLEAMAAHLSPGDVVLDVGANVGNHTMFLAAHGCRVVAYEPNPHLVEALRASAEMNGFSDRVTVRQVGAGAAPSRASFAAQTPQNLGAQSLAIDTTGELEVVRLDDEPMPHPITAVKIDVEGMELDVLEGADRLITRDRPVVFVESATRESFDRTERWLRDRSYVVTGQFNATPTFLFEPAESPTATENVGREAVSAIGRTFELGQLLGEARAARDAASEKYRAAAGEIDGYKRRLGEARAAVDAASEKYRAAAGEIDGYKRRLGEMRAAVDAANEKYRAAAGEIGQYKHRLAVADDSAERRVAQLADVESRLRDTVAQLRAETTRLQDSEARANLLQEERDRALAALAAAERDRARLARRLRSVKTSVAYQAGNAVRRARHSPVAALKLPVTLARLARHRPPGGGVTKVNPPLPKPVQATPAPNEKTQPIEAPKALPPLGIRKKSGRLRVAAVMDEFTRLSYGPEWDVTDLTPDGWEGQLSAADPELLFVESAWRGHNDAWPNMVGYAGPEIRGIVEWARQHRVPTVFWNKEDPVHYSTFLTVASLFDHVFTTDIDSIEHYRAALGHNRVWLLPFAAQPSIHNPIEQYDREDAFVFAGAYYQRYPERTRDLESFVEHLPAQHPVVIYDRNHGKDDPQYAFPQRYRELIVGSLPATQIGRAYKGYRFAINLNSVTQSQTMFARRVFELLASNTITVSNFSRGIRLFFGDHVIATDSGAEAVRRLAEIESSGKLDQLRLGALRTVMRQHTYADRAAYVWSKVSGEPLPPPSPVVHVLAQVHTHDDVARLLENLNRQRDVEWRATLITGPDVSPQSDERVQLLTDGDRAVASVVCDSEILAGMVPGDYYGPHYLLDLALATRWTSAVVIGKAAFYGATGSEVALTGDGAEYRPARRIPFRRAVVRPAAVATMTVAEWVQALRDGIDVDSQVSADRFSYCADGAVADVSAIVDAECFDHGLDMAELTKRAEGIQPHAAGSTASAFDAVRLGELFAASSRPGVDLRDEPAGLRVCSELAADKHDYVYGRSTVDIDPDWAARAHLHAVATPGLDLQIALIFLNADGERVGSAVVPANRNARADVPEGATVFRLGIRVRGSGEATLKEIEWAHRATESSVLIGRQRTLVLTNIYPSYEQLYRNGFVHSRVRSYRSRGTAAEVMCLQDNAAVSYREFEGVDVTTGSVRAAQKLLAGGGYDSVLVHFLDERMWSALKDTARDTRVIVWIHGSEVQPWWRRSYNYQTEAELEREKRASDARLAFWRGVFNAADLDLHFVFVSQYFAEEVMEDVGVRLSDGTYSIIHNPIETDIFQHLPKDPADRYHILSIRPFATPKYANDLSVAAVLALSEEPDFAHMHFSFIGDGALFDETLAPIKDLPNVSIERRFLTQFEIAQKHRDHGVFLVPTRMDAQGVSRDEAMASGLVPVSNAVAAVPEFVDGDSGILVPPDDSRALADAILRLVRDPQLFMRLSAGAAQRVRVQSSSEIIVRRELALIRDA